MLNLIIPPIVIVFLSAALIFFYSRKTGDIAEREQKFSSEKFSTTEKDVLFPKRSRLKNFFFNFSEKSVLKFKIIFLKLYNAFDHWLLYLRKEKRMNGNFFSKNRIKERKTYSVKKERLNENEKIFSMEDEKKERKTAPIKTLKEIRSRLKFRSFSPKKNKVEEKKKLEKILIERIVVNPKDMEAYERLGDYYENLGNYKDALECFQQVLKLSPFNRKANEKVRRIKEISEKKN